MAEVKATPEANPRIVLICEAAAKRYRENAAQLQMDVSNTLDLDARQTIADLLLLADLMTAVCKLPPEFHTVMLQIAKAGPKAKVMFQQFPIAGEAPPATES